MAAKSICAGQKKRIIKSVRILVEQYRLGNLGGEIMPEDSNPALPVGAKINYLYFTLPMALNYQRNSYKLWESANETYRDFETKNVFFPFEVAKMSDGELQEKLVKHSVAMQPIRHISIWRTLCETFLKDWNGNPKQLFESNKFRVDKIKESILGNKKKYPYLSGPKILNYWLFVLEQYTDAHFVDRENITVAPDTHIIQASIKLGLITEALAAESRARTIISDLWYEVLREEELCPIDIHTPLWLWSRSGFKLEVN